MGLRGRVPGRGGVGVVLTVSVWGVLTEFDDLSWTPEIEAADEQGGIGGRRTSEVFVKTTRRVESDAELFANYGTKFRFAGGCVCHSCRPIEP